MNENDTVVMRYLMKGLGMIAYILSVAYVSCYFNDEGLLWLLIAVIFF